MEEQWRLCRAWGPSCATPLKTKKKEEINNNNPQENACGTWIAKFAAKMLRAEMCSWRPPSYLNTPEPANPRPLEVSNSAVKWSSQTQLVTSVLGKLFERCSKWSVSPECVRREGRFCPCWWLVGLSLCWCRRGSFQTLQTLWTSLPQSPSQRPDGSQSDNRGHSPRYHDGFVWCLRQREFVAQDITE